MDSLPAPVYMVVAGLARLSARQYYSQQVVWLFAFSHPRKNLAKSGRARPIRRKRRQFLVCVSSQVAVHAFAFAFWALMALKPSKSGWDPKKID